MCAQFLDYPKPISFRNG